MLGNFDNCNTSAVASLLLCSILAVLHHAGPRSPDSLETSWGFLNDFMNFSIIIDS